MVIPKKAVALIDATRRSSGSASANAEFDLLRNPIFNSLLTDHQALAIVDERAKRFPAEIGPLGGMVDQSPASFDALSRIAGPGGVLALFLPAPPAPPAGWTLLRGGSLSQMVCSNPQIGEQPANSVESVFRKLTAEDVPEMLALAELTEPGPFRQRTIELGNFWGVFESARLLAMAGERLSLPHFIEVSAVCTHPSARGRGYARSLMSTVMADILAQGKTPFLHVFADNHSAIRVYESLGFTLHQTFHLAVLKNAG
jgi:GNAT superfamily N-acetyltransferase